MRHRFDHGSEDPQEEGMQRASVFLPEESHGQRSLVGNSPWGCKELDTTEVTEHTHTRARSHRPAGARGLSRI